MDIAIKNKSSERIVIGILLNHPEWTVEIKGLNTTHFFDETHKVIFHIIKRLIYEGTITVDTLSILARAERIVDGTKTIEKSGGYEYIENIKGITSHYTKQDLEKNIEEILTCAYKREQLEQKEEFLKLVQMKRDWSIGEINQWLYEQQFDLQSKYTMDGEVKLLGDVFDKTWEEMESMRSEDGVLGLPTKIPLVNEYFTHRNGELIVIGARAKYGKSNFGINEAHHLAVINNIPVAYLDTEMKTRTFIARIISIDSGVPIKEIENGTYEKDPKKKMLVEMSKARVKKAPLIHKYRYDWSKDKIREVSLLLQARYGIKMLIYDYIKVKEVKAGVKEHSELGNMTIFLKDLAGEMDIPILTFGQLSPFEIRLADSDKINRYASTIAYLLPKDPKDIARDGGFEEGGSDFMYIDYNRNGASMNDPTKGINLYYTRENVTFEQAQYQILQDEFQ